MPDNIDTRNDTVVTLLNISIYKTAFRIMFVQLDLCCIICLKAGGGLTALGEPSERGCAYE